ncbi:hypothetical protein AM588_10008570 [Phytophthora nicotianae]|uniref:Uncharacterized protein n=1 Tax=Phytophthora nicotianae TaxID=4792 RepID=A0A0W8D7U2_PHYNI|nr:hypothetical protein AM588_10008570 [Phytophthora nicotianae]
MPRRRSSGKIAMKAKKTKKRVHFRSFDLSCLNLQYVEDEQVAVMVDKILTCYGTIMEQLEKMVSHFDNETDLQCKQCYFLQGVFSSLASSSVRFKLRVLFIESEDFGEGVDDGELESRILLDEDGKPFPAMAPYEHQDLGAAIHWALQESVLYWPLVKPLYNMLEREEGSSERFEEDSPVKTFLDENAAEDLDHMEKYVLARRFLRFHLTKSWRHRLKDSDVAETWTSIEKVCSLAKRDEFFAAGTVHGMSSSHYEGGDFALHQVHLVCASIPLGMSASTRVFAQYADHYTCPACFLGRGGIDVGTSHLKVWVRKLGTEIIDT